MAFKFRQWLGFCSVATQRRVLIAEDEALIRLDLKEMLEEEGYDVVGEAGDGEQAVKLAEELKPDLVILDVKMPVLDGISAAEQIVARRIAPVVMLTAFSQRELVERAVDAGAMAYLVKPFAKSDLLPTIEVAVSRHSQLTALENEVSDLQERLETRKIVDRAKGKLETDFGMSEPEAFRWIQKTSMDRRTSMRSVAGSWRSHARWSWSITRTVQLSEAWPHSSAPGEVQRLPACSRSIPTASSQLPWTVGISSLISSSTTSFGCGPRPTTSPTHQIASQPMLAASDSTARSAVRLAWTSPMTATRTARF